VAQPFRIASRLSIIIDDTLISSVSQVDSTEEQPHSPDFCHQVVFGRLAQPGRLPHRAEASWATVAWRRRV